MANEAADLLEDLDPVGFWEDSDYAQAASHDMIALDYRNCGPQGEPRVIHVDQEWDYQVTVIADTFAQFIRSLRSAEEFDLT